MAAQLRTRKPTGRVQYPFILVEGEDKAGKTFMLAQLAASPRVGQVFYLDVGDGTLDEYAALAPDRYELLEHDGTFTSMVEQVEAACAVPSDPERPNVVGVDSGTWVWGGLKAWTDNRARNSRNGRQLLQADPDAEIDPAMNLWNDAKDRWARLMRALKFFPGIGVITAVGREVAKVQNGVPVAGQTEWSVDVEKTTTGWVSGWVRARRDPRQAHLVGVRSLELELPRGGLLLPSEHTLDHLVFQVLGAGAAGEDEGRPAGPAFGPATAVQTELGMPVGQAKARLVDAVKRANDLSDEEAKAEAKRLWDAYELPNGPEAEVHQRRLTEVLLEVAEGTAVEKFPPAPKLELVKPDPEQEPGDEHHTMDGALLSSIIDQVKGVGIGAVKEHLHERGLPRNGSHDDLRRRLARAMYEEQMPQEMPDPPTVEPTAQPPTADPPADPPTVDPAPPADAEREPAHQP